MGYSKTRLTVIIADAKFLDGKVLKQSLPVVPLPVEPDAPNLRRLLLPQGELAQFHNAEEGVRYIAFIELLPGQVRGNHYHKAKEEMLYVIQGEVLLLVTDVESKVQASVSLRAGDLAVIQTGVAHALRATAPGQAIEFSATRFDPADIHPFRLA